MMRRWIAASLVVVLALPVCGFAQPADDPRTEPLRLWLDAVARHRPGETDSALIWLSTRSSADLRRVWADVHVLFASLDLPVIETFHAGIGGNGRNRTARIERIKYTKDELKLFAAIAKPFEMPSAITRLLQRGALVHGDVALLASPQSEGATDSATPQRYVLEMGDGENVGQQLSAPHWELARSLLDQVRPTPSRDDTVRLWYGATLTALVSREHYNMPHLARALALFPDDPVILLQAGAIHEGLADPSMQRALRSATIPRGVISAVQSGQAELTRAQQLFERALRAEPNFAEARLRLGHVLDLQGKHRPAVAELERARQGTKDPLLLYYSGLFLGAAETAQQNLPRARVAYASALGLYPRAQSPRLALSQLAKAAGADAMARRQVEQVVTLPADSERHDPWWSYYIATGRHASALLALLYQRFAVAESR